MNAGIAQLVEHDRQGRGREFESRSRSSLKDIGVSGCLAERPEEFWRVNKAVMRSGLQIRLVRFDSGTRLHFLPGPDGGIGRHKGFKILGVRAVRVQVPLRVPWEDKNKIKAISSVIETTFGWFFLCLQLVVTPSLILITGKATQKYL